LFTRIVSAACARAGIQPDYQFLPWARVDQEVLDGRLFAGFPYARTEERAKSYDFSDPVYFVTMLVFYDDRNPRFARGVPPFTRIEDLRGYRFGGLRAIFYENDLRRAGVEFLPQENVEQSFQMLKAGRIDFIIDEVSVGYANIQKFMPDEVAHFKTLPRPYGDRKISGLLVSRAYPGAKDLLKRFNAGLRQIKASGEYDRIINQAH
jgi:polar amino acid transport system substrate-binding protein